MSHVGAARKSLKRMDWNRSWGQGQLQWQLRDGLGGSRGDYLEYVGWWGSGGGEEENWICCVRLVKAMVFPVVMYECESWTVKKAERRRIDAFELWCWRRLLRVPWTARRSNQSILKEISPGCSLEGMMLKLRLQYFGHLMRRVDSLEKTLMLGGIGGRRRKGRQRWDGRMASLTRWTWVSVNSGSWWWTGRPGVLRFMASQIVGHNWTTELNWVTNTSIFWVMFGFSFVFYVCCLLQIVGLPLPWDFGIVLCVYI